MSKYLFEGSEWDLESIDKMWKTIDKVAKETFGLDYYEPQIEIISSEQMLDAYCITPDHKLLKDDLRWTKASNIEVGDTVLGFDEECPEGQYRKYRNAKVLRKEYDHKEVFEVKLTSGKTFKVTGNHLWFVRRGKENGYYNFWVATKDLRLSTDRYPTKIGKVSDVWEEIHTKEAGWLAGMFDGEGWVLDRCAKIGIAQNPGTCLDRIKSNLNELDIDYYVADDVNRKCKQIGLKCHVMDRLRFLGQIRPERLISKINFEGMSTIYTSRYDYENVESVTSLGTMLIVKITTSTGTFVCDGYPMHNSSVAMPVMYNHWSFGKTFLQNERQYQKGQQGLAYEVVINTNPCLTYLMENNTATLQALVLCHAVCGHGGFFKNNYLFKNWTDADSILDYLGFAKKYIKTCEEKYGEDRVEKLLDACHSLQAHGIDKYKKPRSLNSELKKQRAKSWDSYFESTFNDLWRTLPKKTKPKAEKKSERISEENILYFLEKNSPVLKDWEREVVRIVRKVSQYFYPQRQTQLLNEGWATFCHHMLMTELHDQGCLTDGAYLEFIQNHTNVVTQRDWDSKYYSGINVYALGFAMLTDIKRICMNPDAEDLKWFPDICNTNWLDTIKNIVANYRDESFILQFLSPKVARHFKLFSIHIKEGSGSLLVNATHDDDSFIQIRRSLAEQYDLSRSTPQMEVVHVDWKGDRWLHLEHITKNNQRLDYMNMKKTVEYIYKLWGFPVKMEYKDLEGNILDAV